MPSTYPLTKALLVMKPCNPKRSSATHMRKLDAALDGEEYAAERKFDGCRYMSIGGRFFSSHMSVATGTPVEKTAQLLPLAQQLRATAWSQLILDGEIIYPGGKAQDVVSIAGCLPDEAVRRQWETPLYYEIFDVLRTIEGRSLLQHSYMSRRDYLESLIPLLESDEIHIVDSIQTNKRAFLEAELAEGREGIVLKNFMSLYHPGKRPMWEWIKVKIQDEADVVLMGFEKPTREYTGKDPANWPYRDEDGCPVTKLHAMGWIGAFVFGCYDAANVLRHLGTCSGMDEATRARMSSHPEEFKGRVARIGYMEKTRDGYYRHPRFLSMHEDKQPEECRMEMNSSIQDWTVPRTLEHLPGPTHLQSTEGWTYPTVAIPLMGGDPEDPKGDQ